MANQQGIGYQLDMFVEHELQAMRQCEHGEDVYGTESLSVGQMSNAKEQGRVLAGNLIGIVCSADNLRKAYQQVKRNKGVAGIDQVPVGEFSDWFSQEGGHLLQRLLRGEYFPSAVRTVMIPKPNGGDRQLGIPTVKDRVIQQAISQVLSPIYERQFSDHSYGFRPRRNAYQALKKASGYVETGRGVVVDMDMKSFFDEVNHDRLMHQLSQRVQDKALLLLIRRYLQSGVMSGGLISQRHKGTPQGSPLSPLLSNIVLDELDRELEKRGHFFVRYADDFSIFVRSQKAGERVMASISKYLTDKLKLKVNEEKSVVCKSGETKLLGYTIQNSGRLAVAKSSVKRLKQKVKGITKRNRGRRFESIISELTPILRGWFNYFKHAESHRLFQNVDAWIRRKLRCYRLKQCKRVIGVKRFLKKNGVSNQRSWLLALSGKGWWRKAGTPQSHQAMNNDWFLNLGLYNMSIVYNQFKH